MSLTIIDGTKPMPPKYEFIEPPQFHLLKNPQLEAQRYYEKQKQIWSEGYFRDGVKILSGKHYFYMQEIWLKTGRGEYIRPFWKDSDDLVFTTIDRCIATNKDLFIGKRREIGLTSLIASGLSFWYAVMFPGATLNLTSADRKRFARMFTDKISIAYKMMSPYIMNCKAKNINHTATNVYLKIEIPRKMPDGREVMAETEFNLAETSQSDDSVTNFSSSRTPLTFVDEFFLHPRIMKLLRSSEATRMDGTEKFGFFIGGGTVEETVTQEQLQEFHTLWTEAKLKGAETLFLPAWMGLKQCSVNGWSDEKAGTEWVLKVLEEKEKSSDPNDALAWRKNYPLTEDWIWDLAKGGGAFETDVMDTLEARLSELTEDKIPSDTPTKLISVHGQMESVPDNKKRGKDDGGFWNIEPPKDGQQYYQCIDGAASGKEDGNEQGSWVCSLIFKGVSMDGDNYNLVDIYFERPNRLEDAYRNMVNQFNFFNKYGGMVHINYETNAGMGGNFGTYLDNVGLLKYVMKRKDLTAKGWVNTTKLGTAVDENILESLMRRANIFLRRHASNIKSKMLISQLLLPKNENADIRSAFLIFMASIADWDKPKKKVVENRERTRLRLVKNAQGQSVYEIEKIPVSNAQMHPQNLDSVVVFQNELEKRYGAYWYNKATGEEKEKYRILKGGGEL